MANTVSHCDGLCLMLPLCNKSGSQLACPSFIFIWAPLSVRVEHKIPISSFFVTSDSYHYFMWLLALRCWAKCNRKSVYGKLCYRSDMSKLKTFKRWVLESLVVDRLSVRIHLLTVLSLWRLYNPHNERNMK